MEEDTSLWPLQVNFGAASEFAVDLVNTVDEQRARIISESDLDGYNGACKK